MLGSSCIRARRSAYSIRPPRLMGVRASSAVPVHADPARLSPCRGLECRRHNTNIHYGYITIRTDSSCVTGGITSDITAGRSWGFSEYLNLGCRKPVFKSGRGVSRSLCIQSGVKENPSDSHFPWKRPWRLMGMNSKPHWGSSNQHYFKLHNHLH